MASMCGLCCRFKVPDIDSISDQDVTDKKQRMKIDRFGGVAKLTRQRKVTHLESFSCSQVILILLDKSA